jgi:hypothetical protein
MDAMVDGRLSSYMGETKTRTEMMFPATPKEGERRCVCERHRERKLMLVHTYDADDKQSGIHADGDQASYLSSEECIVLNEKIKAHRASLWLYERDRHCYEL